MKPKGGLFVTRYAEWSIWTVHDKVEDALISDVTEWQGNSSAMWYSIKQYVSLWPFLRPPDCTGWVLVLLCQRLHSWAFLLIPVVRNMYST